MTWSLLDSGSAGFADGNTGHAFSFPGGAASAGQLLVVCVSSDTLVSTPSGWTLVVSDVGNLGAYMFYLVAAGGETSVTITTSGNFPTAIGYLRYSGNTSTPADAANHAANTSGATVTPSVSTGTLSATGELVVAAACLGGQSGSSPTSPSWSSGYTSRADVNTAGTGSSDQHLFVADTRNAGTASESPSVSWTNASLNETVLVCTFMASAAPPATATPQPIVVPQIAPVVLGPRATLLRNAAPAVAATATPGPIVVGLPAPNPQTQTTLLRSQVADFATVAIPPPIVVTPPAKSPSVPPTVLLRSSLQDFASPVTPQPLVISASAATALPPAPRMLRASLVDVVASTTATPQPLVVTAPARVTASATAIILSSPAASFATVAIPGPIVVSAAPKPVVPPAVLIVRSSLQDFATPAPIVVVPPTAPATMGQVQLSRSSLADVIAPGVSTPQPMVVGQTGLPTAAVLTLLLRSQVADFATVAVPAPIVVSGQPPPSQGYGYIARSSFADTAAPAALGRQPIVISIARVASPDVRPITIRTPIAANTVVPVGGKLASSTSGTGLSSSTSSGRLVSTA